ncbi:chitin deacetylase [Mortierella alpina]|nr:chitin deacetylase [Mortierella alpina]
MVTMTRASTLSTSAGYNGIEYHGVVQAVHLNSLAGGNGSKPGSSFSSPNINVHGQHQHQQGQSTQKQLNAANYPAKDRIPDVNSPQVKAWVAELDWSKVPNIPVAQSLPDVPHFPKCPSDDDDQEDQEDQEGQDQEDDQNQFTNSSLSSLTPSASCWWTCSGCVAAEDLVTCPQKDSWGLTYDDGPSAATKDLIEFLDEKQLTATFFIVGSRVLEFPEILKEQVARGHQLAMHTWSHAGLTTLTNQEIVAEIRWTEKIIRDVTGLTMRYVRPPYGDVDNRVREILRQMGYTTVIWTNGWDTNDWRMLQHELQEGQIVKTFQAALAARDQIKASNGLAAGPITLEHDLTDATVKLSKALIPIAMAAGLKPMSLAACLADDTPYQGGGKLVSSGAREPDDVANIRGSGGTGGMEEHGFEHRSGGARVATGLRQLAVPVMLGLLCLCVCFLA